MRAAALQDLRQYLKEDQISTKKEVLQKYSSDWLKLFESEPSMVLFPQSTKNVQDIVKWALKFQMPLVPSGGRTGLSGAACATQGEVILSFERMNQIHPLNKMDQSLTVGAGVLTQTLKDRAGEEGLFFPLSFASEGSSQVGGNVATNAGGVHVIRYGSLRKWITGLEVVTGKGDILTLGRGLVKNVAGYDFLNLVIGSEGTLALITQVTVKLALPPPPRCVFLFAIPHLQALVDIYTLLKADIPLYAFEMFEHRSLKYVEKLSSRAFPLKEKSPYYALVECPKSVTEQAFGLFEEALKKQYVVDGTLSENETQAKNLWFFRENISEALSAFSPYKNDISVKPSSLKGFLLEIKELFRKEYPHFELTCFGHVGDGNLHINVLKPSDMDQKIFVNKCSEVSVRLFSLVKRHGGSVSAEHGVGLLKKPYLHYSCSPEEIECMKGVKRVFDPQGILNPGKIF